MEPDENRQPSREEAPDSAVHPFDLRLFLTEGWELFLRALPALAVIWLVSAALQAAGGLTEPVRIDGGEATGDGVRQMLLALLKSVEAVAIYAVLASRHPGAGWRLRDLKPGNAMQACLLLLAVLAGVLVLAPLLGVLILPLGLALFALASLAPVYVLCDGQSPVSAMQTSWRLVRPQLGRFLPFACVLLALEQLGGLAASTTFASISDEGALATALVASIEAMVSSLVGAVFVATLFRLRGPRRIR